MSESKTTFTFDEDGSVHAISGNQIIASGSIEDLDSVEADANAYIESQESQEKTASQKTATHIITPNGLKGSIIGRAPTVWGDTEVTVRFENNHISKFTVTAGDGCEWVKEEEEDDEDSPENRLESKVNEEYGTDKDSLVNRVSDLREVSKEARSIIAFSKAPEATKAKVASLHSAVESEIREITSALDAMEDRSDYEGIAPFRTEVVAQANIGHDSGGWLDVVASETVEAANAIDLDKVMDEHPAVFASELDNIVIASAPDVAEMARSYVQSKTASLSESDAEEFHKSFVSKVEVARRHELAIRKAEEKQRVASAKSDIDNLPDEALFI